MKNDTQRAAFEALLEDYADAVNDAALAHERGQTSWLNQKEALAAVLAAFDAARGTAEQVRRDAALMTLAVQPEQDAT